MKKILLYTLILFSFNVYSQQYRPKTSGDNQLIIHETYSLSYSEEHEQAEWVYYYLDSTDFGDAIRKNDFRIDPLVETGSATLDDYKGSEYDRGHLCPAADNSSSDTAMSESFFMSNISPQHPSLNRGRWKMLENQFRQWAITYDGIYVVTGGVLVGKSCGIGENKVTVPDFYYKIAYAPKINQMIGFIMRNEKLNGDLYEYATTINSVEMITGIDFFYQLDDEVESILEDIVDLNVWFKN